MFVIVMYDIREDARRSRLYRRMKQEGARVQYSSFELEITEQRLLVLKADIKEIIDTSEDSVRIYRLCSACRDNVEVIGTDDKEEFTSIF
ncbi:MAG: CRISPR-associated endonuclease Cas2 [Methanobacteriota archaeon]|nr:MAG: CRISPR-associated endonuclease Cas2 [Euryarchaeota archaeon]